MMVGGGGCSHRAHRSWRMATGQPRGTGHWRGRALFADQADGHIVEVPGIWDQMTRQKQGDAELKESGRKMEEAEEEEGMSPPSKVGERRQSRKLGVRSSCFEIDS